MVQQPTSEFVDYLKEAFQAFGPVAIRRMFGGHGIFFEGVMIGLVANERLYLKADATTVQEFTHRGLPQFQYAKGGRLVGMSYYLAPDEALDEAAVMQRWAKMAYEAALRSRK